MDEIEDDIDREMVVAEIVSYKLCSGWTLAEEIKHRFLLVSAE